MTTVSERASNAFNDAFKVTSHSSNVEYYVKNKTDKSIFNKFLVIDTSKDIIEFPIFDCIETTQTMNFDYDKIVIPLTANNTQDCRGGITAIQNLNVYWYKNILCKLKYKDIIYFGNRGIILDSSLNPLLMCTMKVKRKEDKYFLEGYQLRLSPRVFCSDNAFEKYIVKTMLPYYANLKLYPRLRNENVIADSRNVFPIKVIIGDFDYFFKTSKVKEFEDNIDEILNQIAVNNIDSITQNLKLT